MNTALLVLRLVPGILFMGHGLQKLVPGRLSPRLLAANGPRATAGAFAALGMEPALPLALLAGGGELGGGLLLAAGLVIPLGTALLAAVMTVAIVGVHLRNGIWATGGGFELPLLMLAVVFAVGALGPGTLSLDHWAGVSDWTGVHWSAQGAVRAGAAVGLGAGAGLLALAASRLAAGARRDARGVSPAR